MAYFKQHHPWRRALTTGLVVYTLFVAVLLWLLPAPVHFEFRSDRDGRQFSPMSEGALVRLVSAKKEPQAAEDFLIERVDLSTGQQKRIPLDPGDRKLPGIQDYIHSRDGSLFAGLHPAEATTVSLWDGSTGKLRCTISSQAKNWTEIACTADNTKIALSTFGNEGKITLHDTVTGQRLGQLVDSRRGQAKHAWDLRFSLDGSFLKCQFAGPGIESALTLFDMATLAPLNEVSNELSLAGQKDILPAPNGFWINDWNRSEEKIILTYLDARSGQRTVLAPSLSRRLGGFPHIFVDNSGHLYLLQSLLTRDDDWRQRWRTRIIGWLDRIGLHWETTDEIELRQISPDGKRLLREQVFSANYAEVSPDGQYVILMSLMKDNTKYVVYRYPTGWNWTHALLWPLIPAGLVLAKRRRNSGRAVGMANTVPDLGLERS